MMTDLGEPDLTFEDEITRSMLLLVAGSCIVGIVVVAYAYLIVIGVIV